MSEARREVARAGTDVRDDRIWFERQRLNDLRGLLPRRYYSAMTTRDHVVIVNDDAAALTVRIEDEGPGIPADQMEKVFEPFYRIENSRSRETGGTGLNLAIARQIAHAHGGDVTLGNRTDGGLEARLTLPQARADPS